MYILIKICILFRLCHLFRNFLCPPLEGTYNCNSDSEGYVDFDNDDDELCYASLVTCPSCNSEPSKARWIEELAMAEVLGKRGKMWTSTRINRDGKTYCSIEKSLFLSEIGALEIMNNDDSPIPLTDMYGKVAEDKNRHGCSWESSEAYRHLKFLGYIVGRHGIPWSVRKVKIQIDAQESNLHFGKTRPIFDVYPPNSKFKKSSPGNPSFVLCLTSDNHRPRKRSRILRHAAAEHL